MLLPDISLIIYPVFAVVYMLLFTNGLHCCLKGATTLCTALQVSDVSYYSLTQWPLMFYAYTVLCSTCQPLLISFHRKHLLERGALDPQYCVQKHSDGTVTLPVSLSALSHLDPLTLQSSVAQDSSCEIIQIQVANPIVT